MPKRWLHDVNVLTIVIISWIWIDSAVICLTGKPLWLTSRANGGKCSYLLLLTRFPDFLLVVIKSLITFDEIQEEWHKQGCQIIEDDRETIIQMIYETIVTWSFTSGVMYVSCFCYMYVVKLFLFVLWKVAAVFARELNIVLLYFAPSLRKLLSRNDRA